MSDTRLFNIIFRGRVQQGAAPETVRANLARLFRISPEKVEALFSGQRVVLKKDADQATTMKFRAALKQAGALCEVEPVAAGPSVTATTPSPASQAATVPVTSLDASSNASPTTHSAAPDAMAAQGDVQMVGTVRTGGAGFQGRFEVAEPGAAMMEQPAAPPPPAPDTGHLSLAPPGTELGELPRAAAIAVPDVGHLTLAPAGADLGKD